MNWLGKLIGFDKTGVNLSHEWQLSLIHCSLRNLAFFEDTYVFVGIESNDIRFFVI